MYICDLERQFQHWLQSKLENTKTNKVFIAVVQARDDETLKKGMM